MIIIGLFLLAFIPMVVALISLRNIEKYNKEKWIPLLITFLWGALIASTMAFVLETVVTEFVTSLFLLVVIVAPVVEELAKPLILFLMKKDLDEVEDGFIFGAVAGLGFAATENLLYGIRFSNEGFLVLFSLFYLRTIGTGMLHASATALTGYGYSLKLVQHRSFVSSIPFVLLAIIAHALFNLFATSVLVLNQIVGVVLASVFAVSLICWIRKRIKTFDEKILPMKTSLSTKNH